MPPVVCGEEGQRTSEGTEEGMNWIRDPDPHQIQSKRPAHGVGINVTQPMESFDEPVRVDGGRGEQTWRRQGANTDGRLNQLQGLDLLWIHGIEFSTG